MATKISDPLLDYCFNQALPSFAQVKAKTGKTAHWDDAPEPSEELVSRTKVDQETGERVPIVDSDGAPKNPVRLAFAKALAKYRPSATNKYGNQQVFSKLRQIAAKVNVASGIRRGRGAGTPKISTDEVQAIEAMNLDL